jgi:hypothetical protein
MQETPQPMKDAERYALSLLEHDGLMTPRLIAEFGPLRAIQIAASQSGAVFHRQSILRTLLGDRKILEASLDISVPALPEGFLERLTRGETPFGQLLIEFSVGVRVIDRKVYRQVGRESSPGRCGRRLTMLRADSLAHLCDVDELLVCSEDLLSLRQDRPSSTPFS